MKKNYYFVGAGGIGMANLVRYFLSMGHSVGGYDRVSTALTDQLSAEGADLVFEDNPDLIPKLYLDPETTEVIFTPAIPGDNRILSMFRDKGFRMRKRAAALGDVTRRLKGICVAGSHGKTTTSSMIAWIMSQTPAGCNAFLGGVLRNTGSNLIISGKSDYAVVEADEYDRSFHQLRPYIAVVTSTDADHLDIYGDEEHYLEAFSIFTGLIVPGGKLLLHTGLKFRPDVGPDVEVLTYSGTAEGDWHAEDVRFVPGELLFTVVGPGVRIPDISLGVPVEINVDNAVAAAAAAWLAGASEEEIKKGLETFKGAKRRFEIWLRGEKDGARAILVDDYAHSPAEIEASIRSIKKLYPGRKVSVIFQPHLYTRTRDFAAGFSKALSEADETILTEIYPARERPIPGVDSRLILEGIDGKAELCERKDLLDLIKFRNFEILMTLGAADLDVLLPEIKEILQDVEKDS